MRLYKEEKKEDMRTVSPGTWAAVRDERVVKRSTDERSALSKHLHTRPGRRPGVEDRLHKMDAADAGENCLGRFSVNHISPFQ
jgi:hypothetical protein